MHLRPIAPLVLLGALALGPVAALAESATPPAQAEQVISDAELLRAAALDEVFSQFGAGIEQAPDDQGLPLPGAMRGAWLVAAREVFDAEEMHADLASAMAAKFTAEDYAIYAAFFRSDFGIEVTDIERTVTMLPAEQQAEARDVGIGLAGAAAGSRRASQIDEMLDLVSADIAKAMIRQSVRGMLIGMSMSGQQGDIVVPWEDIETQLDAIMPDIETDVALTQRAMMFYAYQSLSDADLDRYLEFLRTDSARRFYAVAAFAIGQIVADRMETFGETLARKLAQVNV